MRHGLWKQNFVISRFTFHLCLSVLSKPYLGHIRNSENIIITYFVWSILARTHPDIPWRFHLPFRCVQGFTKDPLKVDREKLQKFGNADVKN